MDKIVKRDSLCYQILFNKPLLTTENQYIYGFRMKYNELEHKPISEQRFMRYIVEAILGKFIFFEIHNGSFKGEDDRIWIDQEGNEFKGYSVQTRLYSYDAVVENMMNYRCDLTYAPCKRDGDEYYWITDPNEYFDERAKMDEDDHKLGRNKWLENYNRIQTRRKVLSTATVYRSEYLDYDIQEFIKKESGLSAQSGCPNFDEDKGYSIKEDDDWDELPF